MPKTGVGSGSAEEFGYMILPCVIPHRSPLKTQAGCTRLAPADRRSTSPLNDFYAFIN
jgi:hypothetical protein